MRILGIDSSSMVASVAVVDDDVLMAEYTINYKKTHSQTLLPMLEEVRKLIELDLSTIDAIAVAGGPGSFTGLRIGSATAKGLGFTLNVPLIHIPTLEAMAYNFYGTDKFVCPIMDARRNQTYTGLYHFENGQIKCDMEQNAIKIEDLVNRLNELNKSVIFTGDGIPVFKQYIADNAIFKFMFPPANLNRQKAGAVASLGIEYYKAGKIEKAEEHLPDYLRLSQAERERKEKIEAEK